MENQIDEGSLYSDLNPSKTRKHTHSGYSGVYLVEYFSQAATKDLVLVVVSIFLKVHPDP